MMKPNMGTMDRSLRAALGIALIAAWPLGLLQGTLGIAAIAVGAVLIVTAAIRRCPPYALLGIDTGADKD